MRGQVQTEEVQPHLKEGLDASGADDIGPVQVQEDGANSEHLTGVILQRRARVPVSSAVAFMAAVDQGNTERSKSAWVQGIVC